MNDNFSLPSDMTMEEGALLNEVKKHMLRKLQDDRTRFVFLYVVELGYKQRECASVMGVHETEISRQMKTIRERLKPFKKGY